MFWIRVVLYLFLMTSAVSLYAKEGAEGGETPASQNKDYSGSQSDEWEKVQTDLTARRGKIEVQESAIKTLLQQKVGLKGEQLSTKVEELKKEHAKLEQMTSEYNKLEEQYETRFPERGLKEPRIYVRRSIKSLETMEGELSLDDRVKRVQSKVLSQYTRSKKKKKTSIITQASSEDQTEKKQPDVTDPIIYQK